MSDNDQDVPPPEEYVKEYLWAAMKIGGRVRPDAVPGWFFSVREAGWPVAFKLTTRTDG